MSLRTSVENEKSEIVALITLGAQFRTYDIGVAPHCPLGPIAFAASLQIGFSTSNFLICEMSWRVSTWVEVLLLNQ